MRRILLIIFSVLFFSYFIVTSVAGTCRIGWLEPSSQPIVGGPIGLALRHRLHLVTLLAGHHSQELQPVRRQRICCPHSTGAIDTRLQVLNGEQRPWSGVRESYCGHTNRIDFRAFRNRFAHTIWHTKFWILNSKQNKTKNHSIKER